MTFRWGFFAGAAALVLSFIVGLFSEANMGIVILRALLFGLLFFGLGTGIWVLIHKFFPELLAAIYNEEEQDSFSSPGSKVDITLDNNDRTFAVPEMYRNSINPDEMGNINDLLGKNTNADLAAKEGEGEEDNVDQNKEEGYNDEQSSTFGGGLIDLAELELTPKKSEPVPDSIPSFNPVFAPSFGGDAGDLGSLPDLDTMSAAFSTTTYNSTSAESDSFGNDFSGDREKDKPLQGDYSAEELAKGIKTVLTKDKM